MNDKVHTLVAIFVESRRMDEVLQALFNVTNVEEVYEVTGEFDIVTLVSATDIEDFRDVLRNIMRISGVKSTVSSFILAAHKQSMHQHKIKSKRTRTNRKHFRPIKKPMKT